MRVLPVLDVMGGHVVRGVGGRRQEYRPIRSRLTASNQPLDVAQAFRNQLGLEELYLADLDALAGVEPEWSLFAGLRARGFHLWVDAGVRMLTMACQLAEAGIDSIVVGLETVQGPAELAEIVRALGDRVVFSLDLREGKPLGERRVWEGDSALSIAVQAVRLGVRRLLVLDLARVGLGAGVGTSELCAHLSAAAPDVEISAGGGVRDRADLETLRFCGVRRVLVASALHDGRLTRADLDGL